MLPRAVRIAMIVMLSLGMIGGRGATARWATARVAPTRHEGARAGTASDPITVISRTDTVHFPTFIDFNVSARDSSSPIVRAIIVISFTLPGFENQENDRTVTIGNAAQIVTLHWREDTAGDNFYPAGTQVAYFWQLLDRAGNWHTDNTQHFTTVDTRFNWQHLSQGNLQVNWYNRPRNFGQMMLNKANASLAHISIELGGGLLRLVNLWIYRTDDDFHGSLRPNSYEWVGGEALPPLNEASIVVVDPSDTTLVRDMPHELTHLVFHQLVAVQVPIWFDEGLAVYDQFYHEPEMPARLQAALDAHALLRLNTVTDSFPTDSDQAYLAYAQSWNLVGFMYSTFGISKMTLFIRLMHNAQTTFGMDLQQAIGENQDQLENQWRIHLHQPPTLAPNQQKLVATAQPQRPPVQPLTQSNADGSLPLLIGLGFILIVVSLIMLLLISVTVNRRKQRVLAGEAAQQLVAANAQRWEQNGHMSSNTQPSMSIQSRTPISTPSGPAPSEVGSWNLDYPDDEERQD